MTVIKLDPISVQFQIPSFGLVLALKLRFPAAAAPLPNRTLSLCPPPLLLRSSSAKADCTKLLVYLHIDRETLGQQQWRCC